MSGDHAMELEDAARRIAIHAGAVEPCYIHRDVLIDQGDEQAASQAYAIATNEWKAGEIIGERQEILHAIERVISMSAFECPRCQKVYNE